MPMPPYQVWCTRADCKNPAAYKIAARWSDGVVAELKTYALVCDDHLRAAFREARDKQAAGHLAPNESLEPPGIFHLRRGQRDQALERLTDLEQQMAS
jgi:hypothetical protein